MSVEPDIAISVVIAALNEEAVIARCLEALARQTFPRDAFEVIVVDNGSQDRTIEIALGFRGALKLRVLDRRGVPVSALRNYGAAEARGPYLAFLDADCIAPRDWLAQAAEALRAEGAGVVGAHYTIPPDSSWVARAWYGDMRTMKRGRVTYVPAGTLLASRDLFLGAGGFDETIATSEDCEFCQRVSEAGFPVEGIPSLSVVHLGTPQTVAAFYRKQRWHGTDVHTVFLRNMLHSAHAKAALFALYTLCSLAVLALGTPAALLAGNYAAAAWSALPALAGPVLLAARQAARRNRWSLLPPLAFLYLVFGVARGLCLLGISGARRPEPAPTQA
jgi:glycosyltransferase involved in cell wall biosynthesis